MKKGRKLMSRIWSLLLVICLAVPSSGLPVYAASGTPEMGNYLGVDYIAALGTSIYIEEGTTAGNTIVWYGSESNKTYVTTGREAGQDLSNYTIYGGGGRKHGSNNYDYLNGATVSITMTGGTIGSLVTGSYRYQQSTDAVVSITGGSIGTLYFGSYSENPNASFIDATGDVFGIVTISSAVMHDYCFVEGIYKNGSSWIIEGNAEIPAGVTVTVAENEALVIDSGESLTNNGTIENQGTMTVNGMLNNNGTITNTGRIDLYAPMGTGEDGIQGNSVARNGAYIETSETINSVSVTADGAEVTPPVTESINGKLYIYGVTGSVVVTFNGSNYYGVINGSGEEKLYDESYRVTTDAVSSTLLEVEAEKTYDLSEYMEIRQTHFNAAITGYEVTEDTTAPYTLNGSELTVHGSGALKVRVNGEDPFGTFYKDFEVEVHFVPVASLEAEIPESIGVNVALTLPKAVINPENATYSSVEWSIADGADETLATLSNGVITTKNSGELTLCATVKNGTDYGTDYTQEFAVEVIYNPVASVAGEVPSSIVAAVDVTLPTSVTGVDTDLAASYSAVQWSIVSGAEETAATLSGNRLKALGSGTITLRATVENGLAYGTDYVQDYTVQVSYIPVTGINGTIPETVIANNSVNLPTAVLPSDAISKTIKWEFVIGQQDTAASISNGELYVGDSGEVTIRAVVENGIDYAVDYTQEYNMKVTYQSVEEIAAEIPATIFVRENFTLPVSVNPSNASYTSVEWTIAEDMDNTGAAITNGVLKSDQTGTIKLKAEIANGIAYGTPFVKEYTIEFVESKGIDIANGSIAVTPSGEFLRSLKVIRSIHSSLMKRLSSAALQHQIIFEYIRGIEVQRLQFMI